MSKLDPRIEAVRAAYGLAEGDFWQIPQNKQWVCKHAALEVVATKANVEWQAPQIIEARTSDGIAVLAVIGKMGDRIEWATGEASPKNNKNAYPWAMAEKRAKDRVVLKLVGIHGLVYSEDEMPTAVDAAPQGVTKNEAPKRTSAAEMKRGLEAITQELLDCRTPNDAQKVWKNWVEVFRTQAWPNDYIDIARDRIQARGRELKAEYEAEEVFPGDAPVTDAEFNKHPVYAG